MTSTKLAIPADRADSSSSGAKINLDPVDSILASVTTNLPMYQRFTALEAFEMRINEAKGAASFLNCIDACRQSPIEILGGSQIAGFLVLEVNERKLLIAQSQQLKIIPFLDLARPEVGEILKTFSELFELGEFKVLGAGRISLYQEAKLIAISHPSREFGAVDPEIMTALIMEHLRARGLQDYRISFEGEYLKRMT